MDVATRDSIRQRAGNRCEYCRMPQEAVDATFHVEHIIAKQHGLDDDPSNLALACDRCNFSKGTNLSSRDSDTNTIVMLFHPRTDIWKDHFILRNAEIVGITPTGRATARLLKMNTKQRLRFRKQLIDAGEF